MAILPIFRASKFRCNCPEEWKAYEADIGNDDGMWLLKRLKDGGAPAELQDLPEVQVCSTVWTQQFPDEQEQMVYKALKKYDGHTQIQNPHDPEASYNCKRSSEWLGDKVQVTETEDKGYPHIITDMMATDSNQTDYEELPTHSRSADPTLMQAR